MLRQDGDYVEVTDVLGAVHLIEISELENTRIINLMGGKFIIKSLYPFPPIACQSDKCFELADDIIILVSDDGEDYISYWCESCTSKMITLGNSGHPVSPKGN